MSRKTGVAADYSFTAGIDVVESSTQLCKETVKEFPHSMVFASQITFRLEKFYHRILHNETAFAIQRRLQGDAITTVILPIRVN